MNGILAYDAVYFLADAVKRAGKADSEAITKALAETKNLQLHHAVITMDEFHNPKDKDGVVLIAKDGKGRFYKKVRPE